MHAKWTYLRLWVILTSLPYVRILPSPFLRKTLLKKLLLSIATLSALSTPSHAQFLDVDFIAYGKTEQFFEALSEKLMVVRSGSTMDRVEGLEGTLLEGMTMRCFGATTILMGQPNGTGNCVLTDPDGDQVLQAWTVDVIGSGTAFGTWYFIGGSGKHEGISGRGHYSQITETISGSRELSVSGVASWPED